MEDLETDIPSAAPRPRTSTVLVLLAVISIIFSYLIAYAMVNALVAAEVVAPWPRDRDPRLRWFAISTVGLMAVFLGMGGLFRLTSRRQLQSLDEMEAEAEAPETAQNG